MSEETLVPLDLSDAIAMIDRQRQRIDEMTAENKRLREALEDIVIWAKGSTCEICGIKKMTETDAYDYARKALRGGEVKE